ncbi:hypothetical protein E4T39_04078 [Aureobasidium subglaciale]|nr:hypothetical protein E4T39_04078 [Aureobasidium subglaciale]
MINASLPFDKREERVADGWSVGRHRRSRALSVALAQQRRFGNSYVIFSMQSGRSLDDESGQLERPESSRSFPSSPPATTAQNDEVIESVPASSISEEPIPSQITDHDQPVQSFRSHSVHISNGRVRGRFRLRLETRALQQAVSHQYRSTQHRARRDHAEGTRNAVGTHVTRLSAFDVQQRALLQAEIERLENNMGRRRSPRRPRDPIHEERDRGSREHQAEGTRRAVRNRERDRVRRERFRQERLSGGGWTLPDASLATGANATTSAHIAPVAPMYPLQSGSSGPEDKPEEERRVGGSPTATPESPSRDCAQNDIEAQQREDERTESEDEGLPRTPSR